MREPDSEATPEDRSRRRRALAALPVTLHLAFVVSAIAISCTPATHKPVSPMPCAQPSASVARPNMGGEQVWARAEDSTEPEREWHYQWYGEHGGACLVDLG